MDDINKGLDDDPRILWDAIKGFISNCTVCYASNIRKTHSSRLHNFKFKLSALDSLSYDEDITLQSVLVKKEANAIMKQRQGRHGSCTILVGLDPAIYLTSDCGPINIFQISAQLSPKMVTFLMNPHRLMLLFAVCMLSYIALRYLQDACDCFLNKTLLPKLSEEDSFK